MNKDDFFKILVEATKQAGKKRKGNPNFPFYNVFYRQCQYEEDFILSDVELSQEFLEYKFDKVKVREMQDELDEGWVVVTGNWDVAKYRDEYYVGGTNKKFSSLDQVANFMPSWWQDVLYFYQD